MISIYMLHRCMSQSLNVKMLIFQSQFEIINHCNDAYSLSNIVIMILIIDHKRSFYHVLSFCFCPLVWSMDVSPDPTYLKRYSGCGMSDNVSSQPCFLLAILNFKSLQHDRILTMIMTALLMVTMPPMKFHGWQDYQY